MVFLGGWGGVLRSGCEGLKGHISFLFQVKGIYVFKNVMALSSGRKPQASVLLTKQKSPLKISLNFVRFLKSNCQLPSFSLLHEEIQEKEE